MTTRIGIRFVNMKKLIVTPQLVVARCQVATYHISDEDTAAYLTSFIQKNSTYPDSLLLESFSGSLFMTKSLLESGVPKIILFHDRIEYNIDEQETMLQKRTRFLKYSLPKVLFSKFKMVEAQQTLRDEIKELGGKQPALRIFSVFPEHRSKYFMNHISQQLIRPYSFLFPLHFECFIVIPPVIYNEIVSIGKVNSGDKYSKFSVILQTFFDISYLTKDEPNYPYLIKVAPKENIEYLFGSLQLLREYHLFVSQNMRPSKFVIPTLEKWIPGCGPVFIKQGYDIFLTFKRLNPSEHILLFKTFSSLEEYPTSIFKYAADNQLSKEEEQGLKGLSDSEEGKL